MASTVRQFSELQPDLDRVSANINVLSRSVANLDCFYQISGLRQSLKNLYRRLDEVTAAVKRLSNGTTAGHVNDHKVESQLRRIDGELTDCQNRMSSLETSCNNIIAWLNKNNSDLGIFDEDEVECMKKIIQQFGETKSEVIGMRSRYISVCTKLN
jgi:septation ring formation regulator EzrA